MITPEQAADWGQMVVIFEKTEHGAAMAHSQRQSNG